MSLVHERKEHRVLRLQRGKRKILFPRINLFPGSAKWRGILSFTMPWHGQHICVCVCVCLCMCVSGFRQHVSVCPRAWQRGKINLLAAAQFQHIHELIGPCLVLCVYAAECELTCYCFQRGRSSSSLIPQDVKHTLVNITEGSWDHQARILEPKNDIYLHRHWR